jgi:hypothetical protein
MEIETREAIRRVLKEAGNTPCFFDLSDGERLNWMIGRAFALGRLQPSTRKQQKIGGRHGRRKQR